MKKLVRLFEKGMIGKVELRNRIVIPAMGMLFAGDDVAQKMIDFYVERAKGGVGLIILGGTDIRPLPKPGPLPSIADDRSLSDFKKLTEAVHEHGAKIGIQVVHMGKFAYPVTGLEPVSPSPVFSDFTQQMPRELAVPEIKEIVHGFAAAVSRAKEAGFDVVDFNCAAGYLIREFLSPITNQRTDEYGGDLKNRMRFLLEIIEAAKAKAGEDYPLIMRISGHEFLPGGNTLEEAKAIARELDRVGVGALSIAPGGNETTVPMSPGLVPPGAFVYLAHAIKEEVSTPVIASGRINDPLLAESILGEGKADFVALGRALLADPEFPNKAAAGRFDEIRRCVGCGQGCFDMVFSGLSTGQGVVTCLVNASVGREREFEIRPAARKKRVMVVGGGPAGMEAARVLALRRHEVSLYERDSKLGGQVNLSSVPPGKKEFQNIVLYLSGQLEKLGVKVVLSKEITPEFVEGEKPDAVVIATGSTPMIPPLPGVEGPNVVTANQVLAGDVEVGQRVVVVGGGGVGCETALYLASKGAMSAETALFLMSWGALDTESALSLARKGKDVTIVEMLRGVGRDIGRARRWIVRQMLAHLGVKIITEAQVEQITEKGVDITTKDGQRHSIAADSVVLAVGSCPNNELHSRLEGKIPELFLIGDSKEPRKALDAIHEAASVARQI